MIVYVCIYNYTYIIVYIYTYWEYKIWVCLKIGYTPK